MTPNGGSQDEEEVGSRPADEVKQKWEWDPARVSDGTEATPGPVGVEAAPTPAQLPDDQEELRRQIDETRADLGDTVEALSAKADVKAQVKEKVDERKEQLHEQQEQVKEKAVEVQEQVQAKAVEVQEQVQERAGEVQEQAKKNPAPFFAAGGAAVLLLLLLLVRRRRSS